MYAVIQTGGKQYRVQPGDIIQVEKLEGDVGSAVKFDQVLFASQPGSDNSQIWLGKPLLSGATVSGQIVGQGRGDKIVIVKMKRRKQYRRTQGHRQFYTQILVTSVANGQGEDQKLATQEINERLSRFQSHLKEKGPAFSPKILGSRKRLAQQAASAHGGSTGASEGEASSAKKKAPAKKAPAKKKAE